MFEQKPLPLHELNAFQFIEKNYFNTPHLLLNEDINCEHENNRIVLGCNLVFQKDIFNLIHEMGHFVEIDDKRTIKSGWGLHVPGFYSTGRYGRFCANPQTIKGLERECRVFAYQYNFTKELQLEANIDTYVKLCEFLPDFTLVGQIDQDNTIFDNKNMSSKERDAKRYEIIHAIIEDNIKVYTAKKFNEEFQRKLSILPALYKRSHRNELRREKYHEKRKKLQSNNS